MLGLILWFTLEVSKTVKPCPSVLYLYKFTILVLRWEWKELFRIRLRVFQD